MHKQTIKTFSRITIISLIILAIFRVATAFIEPSEITDENKYNFKSAQSSQLGNVWVAVSTNIWIRFQESQKNIWSGNSWISLWELSWDALADRDQILSVNILALKDYNNLIKTDIRELLNSSTNKAQTLESFISQLETRFKNGVENGRSLQAQSQKLTADKQAALIQVRIHKDEMVAWLKAHDTQAITTAMDNYLIQTNNYNIAQSNLVFVNYFVRKYLEFSAENKKILDTLINNKQALANGSFIVIPDSWPDLLRDLNLIYSENELENIPSDSINTESSSLIIPTWEIEPLRVWKFYTKDLILNQKQQ